MCNLASCNHYNEPTTTTTHICGKAINQLTCCFKHQSSRLGQLSPVADAPNRYIFIDHTYHWHLTCRCIVVTNCSHRKLSEICSVKRQQHAESPGPKSKIQDGCSIVVWLVCGDNRLRALYPFSMYLEVVF